MHIFQYVFAVCFIFMSFRGHMIYCTAHKHSDSHFPTTHIQQTRAGRLQEQLHQEALQFERAIDLACGELCSKRSRKELDMHKAEVGAGARHSPNTSCLPP